MVAVVRWIRHVFFVEANQANNVWPRFLSLLKLLLLNWSDFGCWPYSPFNLCNWCWCRFPVQIFAIAIKDRIYRKYWRDCMKVILKFENSKPLVHCAFDTVVSGVSCEDAIRRWSVLAVGLASLKHLGRSPRWKLQSRRKVGELQSWPQNEVE